jgi:Zn-dependent M28 family amino/carboxypeptidase
MVFCLGAIGQTAPIRISTEDELNEDVKVGPCKNAERLEAVKKLFVRMGVPESDIRLDKFKDIQNVVAIKKGKTDETIVVGAHYDKVSSGCGTIDNWSGIVILAHLLRSMRSASTEKTYVFVAFDHEEDGLLGSAAMAKNIPKEERSRYCSMVNLDSFGMGYPLILENASSPAMVKFAKELGKELQATVNSVSLAGVADADSTSFKDRDIPAITISALSPKWPQVLHSANDKIENLAPSSVRVGYDYTLRYLVKIDAGRCDAFRKK